MTATREIWREKWLHSINELTVLELQKMSWLDTGQINPHWSFVEFMCTYFDDLGCSTRYSHYIEIGWVSIREYEILRSWHDALSGYTALYGDDHNHKSILSDQKWLDIVKSGETAKGRLATILDARDKEILMECIDYLQINKA